MNKNKRTGVLYGFCTLCWGGCAVLNFIRDKVGMGFTYLALALVFLVFAILYYRKKDDTK